MFQIPDKKQSIASVIYNAVALWRLSFPKMILPSLFFCIVAAIPNFLHPELNTYNPFVFLEALQDVPHFHAIYTVFVLFAYAVLLHRMQRFYSQSRLSLVQDFWFGIRRLPVAILGFIIATIVVVLGYVAFLIPGIILSILVAFYIPLLILERRAGIKQIFVYFNESWDLVWGNWWRTAIIFLIPSLVFLMMAVAIDAIAADLWIYTHPEGGEIWVLHNILRILFMAAYLPFLCALFLVQLHDLKMRYKAKFGKLISPDVI